MKKSIAVPTQNYNSECGTVNVSEPVIKLMGGSFDI